MRKAALLVAVTTLVAPAVAHAGWDPTRATRHPLQPLAAAAPGGAFTLWGAGPGARRLTFPAATATPLTFGSVSPGPWLANRGGDVLLVDAIGDGALLVEAGGARVPMSMELAPGDFAADVSAALGEDGAAVVAWTRERELPDDLETTAWVRVRPPGGQFGPPRALPSTELIAQIDADIAPDGTAEVVQAIAHDGGPRGSLVHWDIGRDSVVGPPVTLETSTGLLFDFDLVAGPPGVGRVIFGAGEEAEATVLTRTGPATWRSRQALGQPNGGTPYRLADGSVVLASTFRREVRVRRAAPGAPFGPPQRLSRAPRGSFADGLAVSSTAAGAVLVAWRETILEWCERDVCFDRVLAAAAGPGAAFGPAQLVSSLGTRTDRVVAALAEDGRRMVAWHGTADDAFAPNALAVAFGDATADPPAGIDRRAPRVRVLAAGVRAGKLRLRLRSNEPVALRLFVSGMASGRAVVLPARRAATAVWSLSRSQRHQWRDSVRIVAADAAANVRGLRP